MPINPAKRPIDYEIRSRNHPARSESRASGSSLFENDANLNSLRKDEQFIAFMAKLKLQWERYNTAL